MSIKSSFMDRLFQLYNQSIKCLAIESGVSDAKLFLYILFSIAVVALFITIYLIERHLSKPYPFKKKNKSNETSTRK